MSELKACPFCGKEDNVHGYEGSGWCTECITANTGVVENWNTRPLEDALQHKLDKAIVILKQVEGMYVGYRGVIIDALKVLEGE